MSSSGKTVDGFDLGGVILFRFPFLLLQSFRFAMEQTSFHLLIQGLCCQKPFKDAELYLRTLR